MAADDKKEPRIIRQRLWLVNIQWLHSFVEAAEAGSLSRAGDKLHLSQPGVGKQIMKLEAFLGVELLRRSSSGVELTEAGALLLQRLMPWMNEWENIRRDVVEAAGLELARINLGTLPSLAAAVLPEKITAIQREGIHVDVTVYNTSMEMAHFLLEGRLDVALMENDCAPTGLWSRVLHKEPYAAVVHSSHRLAERSSIVMTDLSGESMVMYTPMCDVRRHVTLAYERAGLELSVGSELQYGDMILGFVAAGAGVTIVPVSVAERVAHLPLRTLPVDDFGMERTLSLVCRTPKLGSMLCKFLIG
jgi:LysR family transcriptional regulator, transcription activator of glutamate synthase operon